MILHSSLYSPISRLLKANCTHKEVMLFAYERKLARSGAWPLEEIGHHSSISGLLKMLEKVDGKDMPKACQQCNIAVESVIRVANSRVKDYFEDLCLGEWALFFSPILASSLLSPSEELHTFSFFFLILKDTQVCKADPLRPGCIN